MHTSRRSALLRRLTALATGLLTAATALAIPHGAQIASATDDPGWIPWVGPSLDDLDVWVRAFGTSGTTMYAGTEGDGVFRSTNGGLNWSKYSNDLPSDSDSVRDIEASVSEVLIATDGGVWKSTGSSWTPVGQGEGDKKLNLPTQTLYKSGGTLFAGVVGGAYKSTDGGSNWTNISTGLPIGTTVWSIDGYSYLPGYLFAATSNGAFVSLNNGGSWSAVTNGLPTGTNILRILADEENPGTWYAITSGAGVYRTETGGLLWEPVNDGIPSTVNSMLLLPIGAEGSVVVIGTNNGVYTSFDKGESWNKVSNDGLSGHTNIYALTTTPVALALVAGAQGGGVRYRVMAPPINLTIPAVTPNAGLNVGEQLTTSDGTWEGTEEISFTYQWQRCNSANAGTCSNVANATEKTYTLVTADQGKFLRTRVTAHNPVDLPASLTTADSAFVGTVGAAPASLPGATTKNNPTITTPPGPDANSFTLFPGEILTATPNTWNPAATSFAYQWFRCSTVNESSCTAIGDFGANTYTLTDDDVDMFIRARTKGTNANGSATSDLGGATSQILPKQVTKVTDPALAGKPWVGQTLTRAIGSYSGALESAYTTWQVCPDTTGSGCSSAKAGHVDMSGIATLTLDNGHLGKYIRVRIEVDVNDASSPQPVTFYSAFSAKVTTAPAKVTNSKKPAIVGVPATGVVLSLTKGSWAGNPSFTYRWKRCNSAGSSCVAIVGATKKTYKVVGADVGKRLRAEITGINAWGLPVTVQTAATPVAKATMKPVYVTGASVTGQRKVGKTLTAAKGIWSASPAASFTYRWLRNGNPISGATSKSYTLKAADKGATVSVAIKATNSKGSTTKTLKAGTIK